MQNYLGLFLAAIVVGFGLIGLSYLITIPTLPLILFIVGTIIVIVFSMAVIVMALRALFGTRIKDY